MYFAIWRRRHSKEQQGIEALACCRSTFLDSFREQLYPIVAILALSFFVGIGSWITKLLGGRKMEKEVPTYFLQHALPQVHLLITD